MQPGRKPMTLAMLFVLLSIVGPGSSHGQVRDRLPFKKYETLEEIRRKIAHNGYNFTVGHNRIYDMSVEEKKAFFSRRKPEPAPGRDAAPEGIGPLAERLGKVDLPSAFDWRNRNGRSYVGPVRDQGSCGSCYAFAAAAAAEGSYNIAAGRYDDKRVDLSEAYIMYCLGSKEPYSSHFYGCCGSDADYFELKALVDRGIDYEANFPYRDLPLYQECAHWQDPVVKFRSWHRIPCNDTDAIKTAIMTFGPVDAAVDTTDAFDAYSGGVFEDTNTSCAADSECYFSDSDHAISLVGWDDDGDAENSGSWVLRNSWGSGWGESGYMRIKYKSALVGCAAAYLVYAPTFQPSLDLLLLGRAR